MIIARFPLKKLMKFPVEPFKNMEKENLFTDTFRKHFEQWIEEIYLPKLSRAALYRSIIYHAQMAADASGTLIYAFVIHQIDKDQYVVVINGDIKIECSLKEKEVSNG